MDMHEKASALSALLRDAPLFGGLTQQGFLGLAQVLHERRLQRGEALFHRGAPGISLVIVGQGRLTVHIDRAPAEGDLAVDHLGPGAVTGEMSCIDPAPRSATVVAAQDSLVHELTHPALRGLYQSTPHAAVTIVGAAISLLTARLRETNRRITGALAAHGPAGGRGQPLETTGGQGAQASPAPEAARPSAQPVPHRGPLDLSPLRTERGLTDADLRLLLQVAPPQRYPDGALLCREGAPGSSCFLIGSGRVEALRLVGGQQRVMATLGAGALLGHPALVDPGRRTATLRSLGDSVALPLRRDDFAHLLRDFSPLAMRLQEQVAIAGIRQLRLATRRLEAALQAAGRPGGPADLPEAEALRALQAALEEWSPSQE